MKFVTLTATAFVATAISAAAMTPSALVKAQVSGLGFDGAIVDTLSADQIEAIKGALHNGEDNEARAEVRRLLSSFEG